MFIGEAFLSVSLQVLFDTLTSSVVSELGKLHGVEDELSKLQRTLTRLRAMLNDAEQKNAEGQRFTLWLRELKRVAGEAEDVVEEFHYEDLQRHVRARSDYRSRRLCGKSATPLMPWKLCKPCSCLILRDISFRHRMAGRIDGIWRRLEEISKIDVISDPRGFPPETPRRRLKETTSYSGDPQVFGRDELKNRLTVLLLATRDGGLSSSPSFSSAAHHHTKISVVSIVGMGGLGKTTLAQWVYHIKEIEEHFDLRVWVCVSHDFDLKRITKYILEHESDDIQTSLQNIESLNVLQKNLVRRLKGRRFLIILDDVWEEDRSKWQQFCAPLTYGDRDSKVLITTRNARVADMVQSSQSEKIELQCLPFEDCWAIFRKHAFPDGNFDGNRKLESIGKAIVEKLKGVPLAVVVVSGVLRSDFDENKWRHVLENELWELEQGGEDIFPVLKLSYEHLPPHLKHCFAHCSVFPKGWRFDVLDMVQLWMAHGFILPQGKKSVEDVGKDYFNELVNRSLIQLVGGGYTIHELLHDLGRLILQHDFCEIDASHSLSKIPEDAKFRCHLLLHYDKAIMRDLEISYKFKTLRSFFLQDFSRLYLREPFQFPVGLFDAMKSLRILDLQACGVEILPDSIQCLRHLRYLNLEGTPVKHLPEALCVLYKLQTLKLHGCDQLNILPRGMSNLINLHYLEVEPELLSSVVGIGKLTHLQKLELFLISEKTGNKIEHLRDMYELRGKLCIKNLHKVLSAQDAIKAELNNKLHLQILEMEWGEHRTADQIDNSLEESMIEGLQPPVCLRELIVKYYAGIHFPRWINNSSIINLESFCIYKCINVNSFPHFPEPTFLKTLHIASCPQIKEMPHLPTSLRTLILRDLGLTGLPVSLYKLPLEQIIISHIPELEKLPLLSASLKELTIEAVGLKTLPEFFQINEPSAIPADMRCKDESGYNTNPSLSVLKIHSCPYLRTLHEGFLQHHLRHLQTLSIKDCEELVYWPEDGGFLATLCSIMEEITIERCPKLKALPEGSELHKSLEKLVVKGCPTVPNQSLFSQVHDIDSVDVSIEKEYCNLADCISDALQNILAIERLDIEYLQGGNGLGVIADRRESLCPLPQDLPPISFIYDTEETWNWERKNYCMSRNVNLVICETNDGGAAGNDSSRLLFSCLGGHVWISSLRVLILDGIPDCAFAYLKEMNCRDGEEKLNLPFHLSSLETLCILNCRDIRRLPTESLLSHLTALKMLSIDNCPELTLSWLEEGIHSVPSLELLWIRRCPKLLIPPSPRLLNNSGNGLDSLSRPTSSLSNPPPLPRLRYLCIDDAQLLIQLLDDNNPPRQQHGCFFHHHLVNSLRSLGIYNSELNSMMTVQENCLRILAASLQRLVFEDCPNLQNLPADMRSLLPNLKALALINCPAIRCLPDRRLLYSLEFLNIKECPTLAEGIQRVLATTPSSVREAVGNRPNFAEIPVIQVDGVIIRGSYRRFLELKANWGFDPL